MLTGAVDTLPEGWSGRVYAVTAIYAPLGLHDRLQHRWYQDGRLVYASPFCTSWREGGAKASACGPAAS